uniref:Uncharacterized protein n=1 Tax=Chlamydomonas leiostraca TaxID=1034604 RepID=A0A7S0RAL0_9CHLO|mmetsp:Transcript_1779/g.4655  ORF Transcript_1779/g.4655 Transcript_1779/m.4655 type:complete len:254 (+) Transcript_1779:121-882(+)|eukprot:CAMPEP_0202858150 /NCGR_PEP_ID=MMETSP1391-20130828/805_1 /ASSEMBLY_ACC=CAM_ASM_000867 /TAXON_ID=1034604 /ORGANISM="Chlamydomonas leiostraca, Strain SAG 11-49" /LENGTH=253 /DNA_ID=CAMNT_0049537037 /DNA_START=105 /DNA_END=866 /DNA_ORIENTATION=+
MYAPINNSYDPEAGTSFTKRGRSRSLDPSYEFAESVVRQGFIRKVFGLLAVQLAITAAITAAFVLSDAVKLYVAANTWVLISSVIGSFALVITMSVWEAGRRHHPTNLMLLFAFTICEGVLVGAASATYDTKVVLMAAGLTAGVVASLAAYAMQTKHDFTASGGALMSVLFTLIFASILQSFLRVAWLHIAIAAGGAALFSIYLVFDIQLMMGSGAVAISPDEYVFAALSLYLDILNLFLYILQLVNEMQKNN